jgi:REP element-mobilizing transposase RayT
MNRGTDHAPIFDEAAARIFLIELRDCSRRHGIEVHGYCILPNHYHLLLHTRRLGFLRRCNGYQVASRKLSIGCAIATGRCSRDAFVRSP